MGLTKTNSERTAQDTIYALLSLPQFETNYLINLNAENTDKHRQQLH